ncbi:AraC family transcriptional regulator [Leptospira congkakensis]|uniref:AraC family transcriptional regulator n=1 Tax=Leptospira congkakensis TaxID=2484932 RepID=A0A4Z1A4X6_9LEPT|nr:helix-turn-helix domain-containing protein [Leptospira congkakensis]TGL88759.1 AraC family transcriptional regulator [Leptospira congkakensis]TGL89345.1 AraC family transcriptional regulator [Leptospira congkakensis]TGL97313.1 AraC family transcriptional regulator [Leptospira congkakensis]
MNLIPFVGAVISFLLAMSSWIETIQKEKDQIQTNEPKNRTSGSQTSSSILGLLYRFTPAFLFLTLTILQFHIFGELTRDIYFYPFLYGIHIPCLLLLGPFSYIFFEEISGGDVYEISLYHFLPSLLSLFYLFLFRPQPYFISNSGLETHSHHFDSDSVLILLGIGVVSNLCYMVWFMIRVGRWKSNSKESLESSFGPFLYLLLYSLFVVFLFVLAQLFFMQIFLFACFTLTLLLAFLLILKINYKDFSFKFKIETRMARYKESRVKGVNISLVLQRLDDLMKIDRLYLNDELSLATLAEHLDLNSHQLSEVLNSTLGFTFRNYINQFRLQEAASLLKERPDMAILSIIYASGFNSKSAFHKLFQNRYGVSPQVYRSKTI